MAMDAGTKAQQDFLARLGLTRPAPVELPENKARTVLRRSGCTTNYVLTR